MYDSGCRFLWADLVTSQRLFWCVSLSPCVAACCSVLQRVTDCRNMLQRVAVCYRVLQCVAVHCSVLQCVAVCHHLDYSALHGQWLWFVSLRINMCVYKHIYIYICCVYKYIHMYLYMCTCMYTCHETDHYICTDMKHVYIHIYIYYVSLRHSSLLTVTGSIRHCSWLSGSFLEVSFHIYVWGGFG